MEPEVLFSIMLGLAMVAGVMIIYMGLRQRAYTLELLHRERMAMIERGLVPPPEMQSYRGYDHGASRGRGASTRALTGGIVIVALGLGLMTLIGVAAEAPGVAIGLGGAIAIVGAAFIAISIVTGRQQAAGAGPATDARPSAPPPLPPDIPA
jgi:hypothetical protein